MQLDLEPGNKEVKEEEGAIEEVGIKDCDDDNNDDDDNEDDDDDDDEDYLTEDEARGLINEFFHDTYRPRCTKILASRFCSKGPSMRKAEGMTYEDLVMQFRRWTVMEVSNDMLTRILHFINWNRAENPRVSGAVHVKIFLAAYLIANKPLSVFDLKDESDMDDLARAALEASAPMISCFHHNSELMSMTGDGMPGRLWQDLKDTDGKDLPRLLCSYLRDFKAWKTKDEKRLANKITETLQNLEAAEKSIAHDPAQASLCQQVRDQQVRLKQKLAIVAGAKAVEEYEKQRKEAAERDAAAAAAAVSALAQGCGQCAGMSNEQLAHEVLLNPLFTLDDKDCKTEDKLVLTRIRETIKPDFWKALYEDLSVTPQSYAHVLTVLKEIKSSIQNVAQGHPESRRIAEIVDVDFISQRLERTALDFNECDSIIDAIVDVLVAIHEKLKTPERKQVTVSKWKEVRAKLGESASKGQAEQARGLCDALQLVMDRVYAVRVDVANLKLRNIAPVVRDHGVQYERTHFEKKLAAGTITLQHTQKWVKYTVERLVRTKDARVPIERLKAGHGYDTVFHVAMTDLVVEFPHWGGTPRGIGRQEEIPETLLLDSLRIKALNAHFHTDVTSAVMLATVEQAMRRCIQDPTVRMDVCKTVAEMVASKPPKPHEPSGAIEMVMAELTGHISPVDMGMVRTLLQKHVQKSHLVYLHMVKNFKNHWYEILRRSALNPGSAVSANCVRVPDMAKRVVLDTEKHAMNLSLIAMLNKKVHSRYYDTMIADAVKEYAPVGAAAGAAAAAGAVGAGSAAAGAASAQEDAVMRG